MTKYELRKIYPVKQKSLSDEERSEKSQQIAAKVFEKFDLTDIKFLHIFLPIEKNREIETAFIFNRLWKDFAETTTVVPRVNFESMRLENLRFSHETKLAKNKWQILEPTASELVKIENLDVVLVPLLCFDERGFRVGYGKGFYDKFLSECRADCLKVGLSFFPPAAEISDVESFDVNLDYCVIPSAVYDFTK